MNAIDKYLEELEFTNSSEVIKKDSKSDIYVYTHEFGRKKDKMCVIFLEVRYNKDSVEGKFSYCTQNGLELSGGWFSPVLNKQHFENMLQNILPYAMQLSLL